MPRPDSDIAGCRGAHERLLATIAALNARRDVIVDQYDGGFEGRRTEIEAGANRTAAELIADVSVTARAVDDAFADFPDGWWDRLGDEATVADSLDHIREATDAEWRAQLEERKSSLCVSCGALITPVGVVHIRRVRFLVVAAIAVVALFAAADPASASITTTTSALGAGYRSTPAAGITSAKVRFKVPSITCVDDTRFDVLYLGVFGLNGSGESTSYAEVFAACNMSLTPSYFGAAFTAGGGFQQLSIAIGDDIVTRLDENGTTTKATVRNITAGTSTSSSGASARDASVLLGDFGNPTIPTFNRVKMNGATVNGLPFAHDPTPVERERLKSNSSVQIATSLATSGDTSFIMQFRSNT